MDSRSAWSLESGSMPASSCDLEPCAPQSGVTRTPSRVPYGKAVSGMVYGCH